MNSNKALHIAFINPQGNFDPEDRYWTEHPDFGGQLVYVKEVALALGAMGHHVDILTRRIIDPNWPGFEAQLDAYPGSPNVRIVRLRCGGDQFLRKEDLWPYLGTEWVPNILNFYESERAFPQVSTTHYADGGLSGALLQAERGIPFTFTGHSLGAQKMDKLGVDAQNLPEMEVRFHFSKRIMAERVSMSHAARIITSTSQERWEQYGHRAYKGAIDPADENRFAVVPPGVNRRIFTPEKGEVDPEVRARIEQSLARDVDQGRRNLPLVLASSRLDAKKNHIGLVRAFSVSEELRERANLAIVVRGIEDPLHDYGALKAGERAILDQVTELIDEADLWGCVTAFPLDSQAELAGAYRILSERRSVFALTALYEPFGLAPLEAMSCGLPAVVTENGGPSESMVEGSQEFGALINPSDPQNIAGGILRVIGSEYSWKVFRDAGIARVKARYTWDRTAEGYLQVLRAIRSEPEWNQGIEVPEYFIRPDEAEISIARLEDLYLES
jgi:sucrose-phosphate synthase